MAKKYIKYQFILIIISIMAAPMNGSAYDLNNDYNSNFICKYGEDNTSSNNQLVHCDNCILYYDDTDTMVFHKNVFYLNTSLENIVLTDNQLSFPNKPKIPLSRSPPII